MRPRIIKGFRVDKLVVVGFEEAGKYPCGVKREYVVCRCDCGKTVRRLKSYLLDNRLKEKHCGCEQEADLDRRRKLKYVGRKYGKLTILEFTGEFTLYYDKHGYASNKDHKVMCLCDCGKKHKASLWLVQSGHTKSCGCLGKEHLMKGRSYEESALVKIFRSYKNNALKRKLEFELTIEQFHRIATGDCFYCGSAPEYKYPIGGSNKSSYTKKLKEECRIKINGIDRKDNKMGYTLDNSVPCCTTCNLMKRDLDVERFIQHVTKVYTKFF